MNTTTKVVIGIVGVALASAIGYGIYRHFKKKDAPGEEAGGESGGGGGGGGGSVERLAEQPVVVVDKSAYTKGSYLTPIQPTSTTQQPRQTRPSGGVKLMPKTTSVPTSSITSGRK